MKSISHYRKKINFYRKIFGFTGLLFAIASIRLKAKWIVPVSRKWETMDNIYLRLNSSDIPVFKQVFMEEEYGVLDKIEVQDGEIFDVGANIGLTSLYLARKYPEKKIYAIEPDQSNFGLLCLNVSKVANIIPVNCAVWGDKTHSLFIPDDNSEEYARRTHVKETHGSQKVRAMRIDELMEKYAVEKISILKMDAEGAEQNIFSNNPQQWLNRVSSIVIELHEAIVPGSTKAFRDAIEPCFAEIATTRELTLVSRKEA